MKRDNHIHELALANDKALNIAINYDHCTKFEFGFWEFDVCFTLQEPLDKWTTNPALEAWEIFWGDRPVTFEMGREFDAAWEEAVDARIAELREDL